jgi:cytolysin (calcineurin-like family phosphatase)
MSDRKHQFRFSLRPLSAAGALFLALWACLALFGQAGAGTDPYTFFVIGDSQINVERWGTGGTEQTIEWMNRLPGSDFPAGGKVGTPKGVLILGDLQDDLKNPENWATYKRLFDVRGHALLQYPSYECAGNHDLDGKNHDGQLSFVQQEMVERHKLRQGTFHYDGRGYHYSWDWGPVHYVCLNVFPGTVPRPVYGKDAPWNDPQHALSFLQQDLKEQVGDSGRPVIVMWHYGLRGWGLEMWWLPEDLENLKNTLKPYNVVLILHGHEHRYERYQWERFDVIMAPSPQYDRDPKDPASVSRPKGFVVVRVAGDQLQTALYTAKGWSEQWNKTMKLGRPAAVVKGR